MAIDVWVRVKVANPLRAGDSFVVDALVDNGSTHSAMPAKLLRRIGVKPIGAEAYKVWGARTIRRRWGEAVLTIGNRFRTCTVTFEPAYETPVVGAVTLETLGYNIDMDKGRLVRFRHRLRPGKRQVRATLRNDS